MLLGIATILALGAGSSAAAAKPSKPSKQPKQLPDVVKVRIKLIDLYCNTDAKEAVLVNTNPAEKVAAAKRAPCQLLAYRKTLEVTGAEKKKVMEAKSRSFTPAQMRIDRRAMYEMVCRQGTVYAADTAVKSVCANAALKVLMTTGSVGGKGRGKASSGKKPVDQAERARQHGAAERLAKAR